MTGQGPAGPAPAALNGRHPPGAGPPSELLHSVAARRPCSASRALRRAVPRPQRPVAASTNLPPVGAPSACPPGSARGHGCRIQCCQCNHSFFGGPRRSCERLKMAGPQASSNRATDRGLIVVGTGTPGQGQQAGSLAGAVQAVRQHQPLSRSTSLGPAGRKTGSWGGPGGDGFHEKDLGPSSARCGKQSQEKK